MKDIEHLKREGFTFDARFPNEYDLWINRNTMQKLRRYVNGQEWLSDPTTGQYVLVDEVDILKSNAKHEAGRVAGRFQDGCIELEREITCGGHVGWKERKWHVFRKCGCSVNAGAGSLCDLILSLAPNAEAHGRAVARTVQPLVGHS